MPEIKNLSAGRLAALRRLRLRLIHTGSRHESGHVDALVDSPADFDKTFSQVVQWAVENRATIHERIERMFGTSELLLDLPHNTYEQLPDGGVIIRKGSVRLLPGELSVLPSPMSGAAVLIRATGKVGEVLNSMSHGTGRKMARSDCKPLADAYDYEALRKSILIRCATRCHRGSERKRGRTAMST